MMKSSYFFFFVGLLGALECQAQMLESFEIIEPNSMTMCATNEPWKLGWKSMVLPRTIRQGDCLALKIRLQSSAILYLFSKSPGEELKQLVPTKCNPMKIESNVFPVGQELLIPRLEDGKLGTISQRGEPGPVWIFAVALDNFSVEQNFKQRIGKLADVCGVPYRDGINSVQDFTVALDEMAQQTPGKLEWKLRAFRLQ